MQRNRMSVSLIFLTFLLAAALTGGKSAILILVCMAIPAIASLIYYLNLPRQMKCRLKMASYVNKEENIIGDLLIKRSGVFPVFHAQAFFTIENLMTAEKESFQLNVSMMRKKEEKFRFDFTPKYAGVLSVNLEKIEVYGLLGCLKRMIDINKNREIMVLPDTFEINLLLRPVYCMNEEGEKTVMSNNGFDSSVYYGVRGYREGDTMKQIHWKLTGKTDEYVVKELGVPAIMRPVLYIETSVEENTPAMIDAMVEAYVSLSQQMVEEGYRHLLCWYDNRKEQWIWHEVQEIEQLEEAFDLLLRTAFSVQEEVNFFKIQAREWENYGQVAIVSNQLREYDAAMDRNGIVTLLIGKEMVDKSVRDEFIYPFGIDTMDGDLYQLEL